MSRYGDTNKELLFDEMVDFVNDTDCGISELLNLVADVVSEVYYDTVHEKVKSIEQSYKSYKDKYEQIKRLIDP